MANIVQNLSRSVVCAKLKYVNYSYILVKYWSLSPCVLQCSTLAKRLGEAATEAFDWVHQKGVTMVGGRHARTHNNATLIFGRVCCRAYLCTLPRIFVYVRCIFVYVRCKPGVNNVR